MPEVELGPHAVQELDFRRFVTLPKHEITQSVAAGGPDQEFRRWCVDVSVPC